ncbi:MAG: beta-galactosidase trimerization domain-containing protein [Thermomicrobiales bacterium]
MSAGFGFPQRWVHLDFHTNGEIRDVGKDFDKTQFAATVKAAHIDAMTVFSRCHHGYSYHPTNVGTMHPGLDFDLLGAQIEALHSIGVRAPIYITVGWDELAADQHPEWLQIDNEDRICHVRPHDLSSWRFLDLASPYVDYVYALTEEVLDRYDPVDGIFFDIILQQTDANGSIWRKKRMHEEGIDPENLHETREWATGIEREFLRKASEVVRSRNPEATVFFNSRLRPDQEPDAGSRPELSSYSHIEIESLATGGWGYNHFPLFAGYFQNLGLPLLGQTGIFHTAWGDFGSIKPAAALDYECARALAAGAACGIGDHLHPRGTLDKAIYERIGSAYGRVESLEPWCIGAAPVAEIGIILAETGPRGAMTGREIDEGALRMMLELHHPFQFLDFAADLTPYKAIIAPDTIPFNQVFAAKVQGYLEGGGALLLTHRSGLTPDGDRFAPEIADLLGIEYAGKAPHTPDYLVAESTLGSPFTDYHQVLYDRGSTVRLNGAEPLAWMGVPAFTRSPEHFYGHRQAPFDNVTDHPAVTQLDKVIYCHSPLFGAYHQHAVPAYRKLVGVLLDRLAPDRMVETPSLPTTAEVTLLRQSKLDGRTILHLIHAVPQRRGEVIDIVEDELPLTAIRAGVRLNQAVSKVALAPSGEELAHETRDGVMWVSIPRVEGHAVVVFG